MTTSERKLKQEIFFETFFQKYKEKLDNLLHDFNALNDKSINTSSVQIWLLNEFMVANSLNSSQNIVDKSNSIKCKYGYPTINNPIYNGKQLALKIPVDRRFEHKTSQSQLSFDLIPNLVDESKSNPFIYSQIHIHAFYAIDTSLLLSNIYL